MAVPPVTLDFPRATRIGATPMGMLTGSVNISSYDTAHPTVTAITGKFRTGGKLRVICEGVSSNGYVVQWDGVSFRAYRPVVTVANPTITTVTNAGTAAANGVYNNGGALTQPTGTAGITGVIQGAVAGAAPTEAAGAVNVGTCDFIAVGQLG